MAITLTVGSCTSSAPLNSEPNTSLVVTYNGEEVHRRNTPWISLSEFAEISEKEDCVIVIAAPWCKPCEKLRFLIKQAEIKEPIYFLNLEEPWVKQIAMEIGIKSIPVMFNVKQGKAAIAEFGPDKIIMWLLINKK